jgi:formylglycine-generating enzyme required for sulfatase activity
MIIRTCIQIGIAGILFAGMLLGSRSTVMAVDFDEQLRRVAREITEGAAKGRIHKLAVEPFADLEGKVTQTGRLLAAELTTELVANRSVQVIDQRQLAARLEKREAALLSGLSRKELSQIGKELGFDGIIAGLVVESAKQIRLTVKLIAVKNGSLVAASRTTLSRTGLLAELSEPPAKFPPSIQKSDVPPAQDARSRFPEGMVLIPAGPFLYGEGDRQQTVVLPAFWIDLFEVTNIRHAEFRLTEYDPIESHRPVTNVSWNQARQFCQSQGKRLPTEREWEKAARGTDGRQYPWGNAYDPALVNAESRHSGPTDVGTFEEGRSPYGLYDMAGNVWEWTDSGEELVKTYRGGSWASPPEDVRATSGGSIAPAHRLPDLGFRCAMDGPR